MARLGGLSRRRRGRPLNAEVNIINLVDVMLVLLIIFMVTAPIMQGGLKVDLPKMTNPPMSVTDPLIITVQPDGGIAIGEKRYSALQAENRIAILGGTKVAGGVIVMGDSRAPYGVVLHVLDLLHTAGFDKASLATQPANPQ